MGAEPGMAESVVLESAVWRTNPGSASFYLNDVGKSRNLPKPRLSRCN